MIDVDGCRLAIEVSGSGSPTVVMLSSLGGAHQEWSGVVSQVGSTTLVTYGRPALGGSERLSVGEAQQLRTGSWAAAQLRSLLIGAEHAPPYLLVTGSIGAYIGDQFAASWPDEVAGLVMIDPTNLAVFPGLAKPELHEVFEDGETGGGIRFGRQACVEELYTRLPAAAPRRVVLSSAHDSGLRNEPQDWHQPLTLADVERHWRAMQDEWVDRLGAHHLISHTAGHLVHSEEPGLAAHVITATIDAARRGDDVEFDRDALDRAGARLCPAHPDPTLRP
jgi:pimeloyl-ACP methyl ester carboxylesterase